MGAAGTKKVEPKEQHITELKCNDCELVVRLTSEKELTETQRDELQARIVCAPCEKKRLEAKK